MAPKSNEILDPLLALRQRPDVLAELLEQAAMPTTKGSIIIIIDARQHFCKGARS